MVAINTTKCFQAAERVLLHRDVQETMREDEIYILLDDGRLMPVQSGGMVELALKELGARLVGVEAASNPGLN
jgi:hypothetical protein